MKFNDATEAAYKNGYADGVKETEEKLMLEVCDLRIELKAERGLAEAYKAEIERLKPFEEKIAEYNSSIRVEDMLVFASSLEEWLEFCDDLKAEAYKEFAERLCEGRVSNDPVVIAAKVELTEMESERE